MYNQPTTQLPDGRIVGTLYKNPIDCLWKTFKAEGVSGWYKGKQVWHATSHQPYQPFISGSTAHFLRIAPHT